MDFLTILIICSLSTWGLVEYLHHSKIGALWRWIAFKLDPPVQLQKYVGVGIDVGIRLATSHVPCFNWLGYLMSCSQCMSFWIAVFMVLTWPHLYLLWIGMAAARLANVLNDITHPFCRSPNDNPASAASINNFEIQYQELINQNEHDRTVDNE